MESWLKDLRYGARLLWKAPAFAAAAVGTLALGIGANTTIFGLVSALLLRPTPGVSDPARIVAVYTSDRDDLGVSSLADLEDFRRACDSFQWLAAYRGREMELAVGGEKARVDGMLVDSSYFRVLGLEPFLGRFLLPEDDVPDASQAAVISHRFWTDRFAADERVLGLPLILNGREFVVVGVLAPPFRGATFAARADVFVPISTLAHFLPQSAVPESRAWRGVWALARLRPGVDALGAAADVHAVGAALAREYPATNSGRDYEVVPFRAAMLPPWVRPDMVRLSALLMSVVGVVLLIACVNVANLVLARSRARRREIAVRQALGARRTRLVRQLVIESWLLSALGGITALLVAQWAVDLIPVLGLPFALDVGIDLRVVLYTAAVAMLTGLLFGLTPALRSTRHAVTLALKGDPCGFDGIRRLTLGNLLVVGQVALSMLLIVAAGLFARTLVNLGTSDLGFEARNVLVADVDTNVPGAESIGLETLFERLGDRIGSLPGVTGVAIAAALPGETPDAAEIGLTGDRRRPGERRLIGHTAVSPGYFKTMGISLLRGREFLRSDRYGPGVVVVNQAAARLIEDRTGLDPLGAGIVLDPEVGFLEVVGIVADSTTASIRQAAQPFVYRLYGRAAAKERDSRMLVLVRTVADPGPLAPSVRARVADAAPEAAVSELFTLQDHLASTLSTERVAMQLTAASAGLALALAAVGLYSVMAFAVSQRTIELGVRQALGAEGGDVLRMIVRHALRLVGVGLAVGSAASIAGGRLIEGFLYDVAASDPTTYLAAAALLLAVALLASWVPARRASQVDPAIALRQQ